MANRHFYTAGNDVLPIEGMYNGCSAFLICSGPSLKTMDLEPLRAPGILSLGVNNSMRVFRSRMWVSVDDPANFIRSAWFDPTIQKFIRMVHAKHDKDDPTSKRIFNSDEWKFTEVLAKHCPNVAWWPHTSVFTASTFLSESTVAWGDESEEEARKNNTWSKDRLYGGRSVMLAALKILYILGIKNVYLLGCDFNMSDDKKYAFEQHRSESSIAGNNASYSLLRERFRMLRPVFDEAGFNVWNATPGSHLTEFKTIEYSEAVKRCLAENRLDFDLSNERTEGLYDRKDNEKKAKQEKTVTVETDAAPTPDGKQAFIEAAILDAAKRAEAEYDSKASGRKYKRLVGTDDQWVDVAIADLRVGDRVKVWEADGKTRVKIGDSKEWSIGKIDGPQLTFLHWTRETHIKHVKSGKLLAAIAEVAK